MSSKGLCCVVLQLLLSTAPSLTCFLCLPAPVSSCIIRQQRYIISGLGQGLSTESLSSCCFRCCGGGDASDNTTNDVCEADGSRYCTQITLPSILVTEIRPNIHEDTHCLNLGVTYHIPATVNLWEVDLVIKGLCQGKVRVRLG